MSTSIVSEEEFRRDIEGLLRRVRAGTAVIVEAPGERAVRLAVTEASPPKRRRPLGTWKGVFRIPDDFDETPIEFLESIDAPFDQKP